jgi:hypothetical protein
MKNTVLLILMLGIVITILAACSKKETPPAGGGGGGGARTFSCAGITPKFATDVQPIINSLCATNSGCHASGSTNSGGSFTTYTQISGRKSNIRTAILNGSMPQSGTISQNQINR